MLHSPILNIGQLIVQLHSKLSPLQLFVDRHLIVYPFVIETLNWPDRNRSPRGERLLQSIFFNSLDYFINHYLSFNYPVSKINFSYLFFFSINCSTESLVTPCKIISSLGGVIIYSNQTNNTFSIFASNQKEYIASSNFQHFFLPQP